MVKTLEGERTSKPTSLTLRLVLCEKGLHIPTDTVHKLHDVKILTVNVRAVELFHSCKLKILNSDLNCILLLAVKNGLAYELQHCYHQFGLAVLTV
jgi:hypothetical protein